MLFTFSALSHLINSQFMETLLGAVQVAGYVLVALVFLAGLVSIFNAMRGKSGGCQEQPALPAISPNPNIGAEEVTDKRVIAAISAAISEYYKSGAQPDTGFVVRSIKRRVN